jgi:hypothetical protein
VKKRTWSWLILAQKYRKAHAGKSGGLLMSTILPLVLIAAVIGVGYYAGVSLGYWGAAPTAPGTPEGYTFIVQDPNGDVIDDLTVNVLSYELDEDETYTADELEEITDLLNYDGGWVDEATVDADGEDHVDFDDQKLFRFVFNATGYSEIQAVPTEGENVISTAYTPTQEYVVAYSLSTLTTTYPSWGGNAALDEWGVHVIYTDADVVENDTMGYVPSLDFDDGNQNYLIVKITFNATVGAADVDISLPYEDEVIDGDDAYYLVNIAYYGSFDFTVSLNEDDQLADWEMDRINICFGDLDSMTVLCYQ